MIFPWRLMQMDSLFYERQIEEIQQKNIEGTGTYTPEDDYQYRFKKEDTLIPIVNLVLYWGKQAWKHPLGLEDMSDMRTLPKKIRSLFQDYGIHVVDMRGIPDEALECMNIGRMNQLLEYAKTDETEEEETDMCKALEMMEKEAEARGIKQGIKQLVQALVETCAELGLSKEKTVDKVVGKLALSEKDATEYVNQYWC